MTLSQQLLGMVVIFGSAVLGTLFMGAWQIGIIAGLIALCLIALLSDRPIQENDQLHPS